VLWCIEGFVFFVFVVFKTIRMDVDYMLQFTMKWIVSEIQC